MFSRLIKNKDVFYEWSGPNNVNGQMIQNAESENQWKEQICKKSLRHSGFSMAAWQRLWSRKSTPVVFYKFFISFQNTHKYLQKKTRQIKEVHFFGGAQIDRWFNEFFRENYQ